MVAHKNIKQYMVVFVLNVLLIVHIQITTRVKARQLPKLRKTNLLVSHRG